MWREIAIPDCPSEIRGYTHVDLGVCFVATPGGLYALRVDATPTWERVGDRIEDYMLLRNELVTLSDTAIVFRDVHFALYGYPLLDDIDFSDLPLETHPNGQRLTYDPNTDRAVILAGEAEVQRIDIGISGEWTTAGFSSDGRHLTFASLECIRVFEVVP